MTNISLLAVGKLEVRSTELFTTPTDRERAARFLQAADRHRSLVAAGLLRLAAAEVSATEPRNVELTRHCPTCAADGDHGQPVVRRGPAAGVHLSASHAGEVVAVVASTSSPVGVDVELVENVTFSAFDHTALTPCERARVFAFPAAHRNLERARLWTAKEAALKARGLGLTVDPSSFEAAAPGHALEVARLEALPDGVVGHVAADASTALALRCPRPPHEAGATSRQGVAVSGSS